MCCYVRIKRPNCKSSRGAAWHVLPCDCWVHLDNVLKAGTAARRRRRSRLLLRRRRHRGAPRPAGPRTSHLLNVLQRTPVSSFSRVARDRRGGSGLAGGSGDKLRGGGLNRRASAVSGDGETRRPHTLTPLPRPHEDGGGAPRWLRVPRGQRHGQLAGAGLHHRGRLRHLVGACLLLHSHCRGRASVALDSCAANGSNMGRCMALWIASR